MSENSETAKINAPDVHDSYQEFVLLMVTLDNNIVLYPPEHDSIRRVTEALHKQAERLLDQIGSLTLVATQDRLIINGHRLPAANARNRKFALFLSQRGILSVTMELGLTGQELVRFLEILHKLHPKTDIKQNPSLAEALAALPHIDISQFELKSVRVQNQDQVKAPDDTQLQENRWERIIQGGLANPEDTAFIRSLDVLYPEFARSLQDGIPASADDPAAKLDDGHLIEELQKHMSGDMLLAVGMHTLTDHHQISPALQKLISAVSLLSRNESAVLPPLLQDGTIGADAIQKLFEREKYEDFVSPEYNNQLSALTRTGEADAGTRVTPEPIFQETDLQEGQISRWLAKGLLGLLSEPYDDEVHRGCSEQLGLMIPEFMEQRDYDLLGTLHLALTHLETQSNKTGEYARKLRESYSGNAFINQLRADFTGASGTAGKALEDLILMSGPQNIPWLLDFYDQSDDGKRRNEILKLLLMFKNATAEAVLNRITTLDHKNVKPMLRLVILCGGNPADARLYPLLEVPEPDICMEVMRMCLSAGSSAPVPLLVKIVRSKDPSAALTAIRIAGEYKVKNLAAELVRLVRTLFITKASASRNRAVLETLNQIGDGTILPVLLKLAKARLSLTPGRLRDTQEALFTNIWGYPDYAFHELREIGLRSKNQRILKSVQKYR